MFPSLFGGTIQLWFSLKFSQKGAPPKEDALRIKRALNMAAYLSLLRQVGEAASERARPLFAQGRNSEFCVEEVNRLAQSESTSFLFDLLVSNSQGKPFFFVFTCLVIGSKFCQGCKR